jgi:5-dehydro-2-deoxygluconokinase
VAIGTEEEFHAALAPDGGALGGRALTETERADLDGLIDRLREDHPGMVLVIKRGPRGATVLGRERLEVAGYPVEVLNTVGAGDAFASGLIHGMLAEWDWHRTIRFANACGAIEVTRHGCSSALPTVAELMSFVEDRGGL